MRRRAALIFLITLVPALVLTGCSTDTPAAATVTHRAVAKPKPPAALAAVGVPKLVMEHDGSKADITLDAVHFVAPVNGAQDMLGVYVFTIHNVGTKPFNWDESRIDQDYGSLAEVNAPHTNNSPYLSSFSDLGTDLTPYTHWAQPMLVATVKPGRTRKGIVSSGIAASTGYVVTMDDMTDTSNMSSDQALPIELTTKAQWVLKSPKKP